jgi:Zn ribbon nucleic-acid-binding protein
MTAPQITLTPEAAAPERRPCPLCNAQMVLACVRPAGLGIDLRTFECVGCNYLERVRAETVRRHGVVGRIDRHHE